ncbi:hypothetical protein LMG10661_03714 [Ralstonia syzygii subsp. syzygii]|nr:hypothetical protein LMG10661_03714 [Ralstonia syzygii subsp. syzygii]
MIRKTLGKLYVQVLIGVAAGIALVPQHRGYDSLGRL